MPPAYLTVNRPARSQWYARRNRPLTGCTVLHTTESAFDEMGADTGAEAVSNFIRTRSTPGSYHDIVDSDSWVRLVEYVHGAYHDGTGSNNWALALSFACRTTDWRRMPRAKRASMLRNGARAFAEQQRWRKANGAPYTRLRLITKAQSDAGWSGLTYHGYRDPGRRSDPGVSPPDLFPFDEFIGYCREELAGTDHPDALEDELSWNEDINPTKAETPAWAALMQTWSGSSPAHRETHARLAVLTATVDKLTDALSALASGDDVDAEDLKAHISSEVTRAMETFRERVAEGYDVRLQPKGATAEG